MRPEELKESYLRIISTADQEDARHHYEGDPDSHISGTLMTATHFLRMKPKDEEAFCEIMDAILSKDYLYPNQVERYLDRLRRRSDSRIGLLDKVWTGIREPKKD